MPLGFSTDVSQRSGTLGTDDTARVGFMSDASLARTGGRVDMASKVRDQSTAVLEGFRYRHFDSKLAAHHHVELLDSQGRLKWAEDYDNLITTAGLNRLLDAAFKSGAATPAWFYGLVDGATTPTYDAGDTVVSHAGWSESVDYLELARQAWTPGTIAAGSLDNAASRAAFTMDAGGTIAGCFLVNDDTKGGSTTGTIYGVGGFTGGSRAYEAGDTLRLTSTLSASE